LIKQQFELLKHEVKEDFQKTRDATLMLGIGSVVALVGLIHLTLMLVYLLQWAAPSLPLWACFGICGGLVVIVGGGLLYAGIHKFNSFNPLPDETAQALKENVQWITQPK